MSVEWSYLPRNASNFTCSHLDLKNFPQGRNPWTPAYRVGEGKRRGGEGGKGFLPLKGEGGKDRRGDREEKVGEEKGQQQGGILLQGLRGDRRPCMSLLLSKVKRRLVLTIRD